MGTLAMEKKDRVAWLDAARGICILLVVVGHSEYTPAAVSRFIYTFHMPFFFFCSGIFADRYLELPFRDFVKQKARAYLLPYLSYEILFSFLIPLLSFLTEVLGAGLTGGPVPSLRLPHWNALLGIAVQQPESRFAAGLWFLTALFVVNVLFYLLHTLSRKGGWRRLRCTVTGAVLAAFLFHRAVSFLLPWYLEGSCLALPYFAVGWSVGREGLPSLEKRLSWQYGLAAGILCALFSWLYWRITGSRPDYHLADVEELVTAYCAGICGILFVSVAGKYLEKSRLLRFIGENSLLYYLFGWAGARLLLTVTGSRGWVGPAYLVMYLLGNAVCTVPLVILLKKYCGFYFGLKRNKSSGEAVSI